MLENKPSPLFLAALNPYTATNEVENIEKKVTGKNYVIWGNDNKYPQYLYSLYSNCATLQSIINGTADYVSGDDATINIAQFATMVNKKGETIRDIIQKIAMDYVIFGAFSLEVHRNLGGGISEIYWLDVSKLRSDEKNEVFYFSEDWNKSYGRVKTLVYPKFSQNDSNPTSIFYFKNNKSRGVYGCPMWNSAVKNVAIDIAISDFHSNEIHNNFLSSKLISFNNGIPDDELKTEIERNLNEKFSGKGNAGRVMISFAQSKDNAPEILNLASDDFDKRYETLEKRNNEQIFVAFRATPVLFGLINGSNGFSTNEYSDSYKLFNRTVVQPMQKDIVDSLCKIFGDNAVEITPFSISFDEDKKEENVD